jgi:uncharacterized membrane protein YqaE (UPF0057 family)
MGLKLKRILEYILMVFLPPLYLFLKEYRLNYVLISAILYILGWFPSVIFAFYAIKNLEKSKKQNGLIIKSSFLSGDYFSYIAPILYLLFQFYLYNPMYLFNYPNNQIHYIGGPTDPFSFIWLYHWWQFALSKGINPLFSNYVWAPEGISLSFMPIPVPALIMLLLTKNLGAIASYNIVQLLMEPLGAFGAFILIKYLLKNNFAALIGGFLYGFSPYALGHVTFTNLDILFPIPLLIYFIIKYLRNELSDLLFVIIETLLFIIMIGFSTEIFAIVVFFGTFSMGFVFIYFALIKKTSLTQIIKKFIYILAPIIITFVLYIPILFAMMKNYSISAPNINFSVYPSDMLSWLIPAPSSLLASLNLFHFSYNNLQIEDNTFFGLPLLLISLYILFKNKTKFEYESLFVVLIFLLISNLSVEIIFNNIPLIPNPGMIIYSHIPLIKNAMPNRFGLYIWLILAFSFGLFWVDKKISSRTKVVMLILVLIFWFPQKGINRGSALIPSFFLNHNYENYIMKNSNVLILPYAHTGPSMLYQSLSNYYFKMPEGYTTSALPDNYFNDFSLYMFLTNPTSVNQVSREEFTQFIKIKDINYVIVVPYDSGSFQGSVSSSEFYFWNKSLTSYGYFGRSVDGVIVYKV